MIIGFVNGWRSVRPIERFAPVVVSRIVSAIGAMMTSCSMMIGAEAAASPRM